MSKPLIALRNKISRQAYEVPADEADQILAHPVWGKVNEVVRTAKPEVLHATGDDEPSDDQSTSYADVSTQPTPTPLALKSNKKKDNA